MKRFLASAVAGALLIAASLLPMSTSGAAIGGPEVTGHDSFRITLTDIATNIKWSDIRFVKADGWDDGGRNAYKCAFAENYTLDANGAWVLRFNLDFDRYAGYGTQINDKYMSDLGASNICGPASDQGNSDPSGVMTHHPHMSELPIRFYQNGVEISHLTDSIINPCGRGYWIPGNVPGEAIGFWDPDFPVETMPGAADCTPGDPSGADEGIGVDPIPAVRLHVELGSLGPGVGICTINPMMGNLCAGYFPPPTSTIACNAALCVNPYVDTVSVSLTATPSGPAPVAGIHYTTDGSTPDLTSPTYTGPFNLTASATVRWFSVDNAGNAESVQSQAITVNPLIPQALLPAGNSRVDCQVGGAQKVPVQNQTSPTFLVTCPGDRSHLGNGNIQLANGQWQLVCAGGVLPVRFSSDPLKVTCP